MTYNLAYGERNYATALSIHMARVQQEVELDRINPSNYTVSALPAIEEQETAEEIEQVSLPPTDRGKNAWLVLAGCSLIQIPVWGTTPNSLTSPRTELTIWPGYSIAFGVFQEYYGRHPLELKGDTSNVAVIGTTMTVSYSGEPLGLARY